MVTLFKLLEELLDCFPKQLHRFTVPQAVWEGSEFSMFPAGFYQLPVVGARGEETCHLCSFPLQLNMDPTLSLKKAPGSLALSLSNTALSTSLHDSVS